MLLLVTAAVAAFIVRVPETVTAPFVLAPHRGGDPVRAFRSGMVSEVRVVETQAVGHGDAMFTIASSVVGDRAAEWKTLESQIHGVEQRLASRRQKDSSQRRADLEEVQRLEDRLQSVARRIVLWRQQLKLAVERAERQKLGFAEGLISWIEMTRFQSEADSLAVELEQAEGEQVDTRRSLERLRHESEVRRAESKEFDYDLLEELDRSRIRRAALDKDLVHQGNQLVVAAPCAGVVLKLSVRNRGAVVQEGEVLAEVSCGSRLQAELTLPQEGAALIQTGQRVKLLYAAFPYQRYGAQAATIRWISPAGEAAGLRALADLERETVPVHGQPRALVRGMGGQARVVVGRRTLVSYAFEPIRQIKENLAGAGEDM
jgi:membrane fusion protein